MPKIYTKSGDLGTTALGSGERLSKDAIRIEAYGAVDEVNSLLGVALALGVNNALRPVLQEIQNDLFVVGGDLACPPVKEYGYTIPRMTDERIAALESVIDRLSAALPALTHFILPGGSPAAAHLHLARTVARRAERRVVTLQAIEGGCDTIIRYLNRLSDLLFVMARYQNAQDGTQETPWAPNE